MSTISCYAPILRPIMSLWLTAAFHFELCGYVTIEYSIPFTFNESDHLKAEIRPYCCAEHGRAKGRSPGIQSWSTQSRTFWSSIWFAKTVQHRPVTFFSLFLQVATANTPLPGGSTRAPAPSSNLPIVRFNQTNCIPLYPV